MVARQCMGLVFHSNVDVPPAALIYHAGRWKTGLLGAPQNRCCDRLRVKRQEEGNMIENETSVEFRL